MKDEVRVILRRAEDFFKDAEEDFKRKSYDIAMFHIEQACQLIIKAKLLDLIGFFERTHSLRKLLHMLSRIFKTEDVLRFIRENKQVLRNLEYAYITARYLPEEFDKEDVLEAFEVYKKLRDLLWK